MDTYYVDYIQFGKSGEDTDDLFATMSFQADDALHAQEQCDDALASEEPQYDILDVYLIPQDSYGRRTAQFDSLDDEVEEDYLKPESRLVLNTINSMLSQLDNEEIEMMKDDLYNAISDNMRK